MRTHITGIKNAYYETEEEAESLPHAPFLTRQLSARRNDNQTWTVSRTTISGLPREKAVPLKLRLTLGLLIIHPWKIESSSVVAKSVSLKQAFDLIRNDEEKPRLLSVLPAHRQYADPDLAREYWRNMPQPL